MQPDFIVLVSTIKHPTANKECLFNTIIHIPNCLHTRTDIFIDDMRQHPKESQHQTKVSSQSIAHRLLLLLSLKLKSMSGDFYCSHTCSPDKSISYTSTYGKQHWNRYESFIFSSFNVWVNCIFVWMFSFRTVFSFCVSFVRGGWKKGKVKENLLLLKYFWVLCIYQHL